ncbi:MAG: outer membrane protein assembly factor BamE [Betaproteobacteria bacterium]|nr:MAG: outer membrane protein assembly factor BamE [Betaproteobacteria bacterium]
MFVSLVVAVFYLAVAGCASSGSKIEQSAVSQIKVGKTSKYEMLALFGSPLSQSFGSEGKLTMLWHCVYVGPFGMGMEQQNLTVLFDQNDKVERYSLTDNSGNGPRLGR